MFDYELEAEARLLTRELPRDSLFARQIAAEWAISRDDDDDTDDDTYVFGSRLDQEVDDEC